MTLITAHQDWAWVTVFANAAVGAWATAAHWVSALRGRALWWTIAVAELTVFVQVGLGVALINLRDYPLQRFHAFYGFFALFTIGVIYSYRHQVKPWRYLLYGGGSLFIMGLCIRSMTLHR